MVLGRQLHIIVGKRLAEKGWLVEFHVSTKVDGMPVLVVGKIDAVDINNRVIVELKSSRRVYPEHTMQLEIYRWIMYRNTGYIYSGEIWLIMDNGNKIHRVKPFLRDIDYTEKWVVNRVKWLLNNINDVEKLRVKNPLCFRCPMRRRCYGI